MKLYNVAAGLPIKKHRHLQKDIQRGISAISRVASIDSKLVGTARYRKMPFGDIDLFSELDPEKIANFVSQIQKIVRKLPKKYWFSDMKAGGGKRGLHWTKSQVLAGRRGTLTLHKALQSRSITKLDVIIPLSVRYRGRTLTRYVEMTNFFYFPKISLPFGDFLQAMLADVAKYTKKSRKLKVLKRKLSMLLWTDYKRDQSKIKKISKIIQGKAGILGTYLADCETARLLAGNQKLQSMQLKYISIVLDREVTLANLKKTELWLKDEINSLIPKID